MVEEALAAADRQQASLRTQVTLLKQSHVAAQEEITRLRGLLAQRNVSVPPIAHFPNRRRPESFYVGDAADPDSDRSSASSCPGAPEPPLGSSSPRRCAEHVPTADTIGDSDWVSFDMVATLVAGPSVDRIGVGFLALPPVPLVVKRVRDAPGTTSVTRGSWADQQGIRCGDEFMSVDRKRSRAFTSKDFTETMKKRPLQIKLRRTARKEGAEAVAELRAFGAEDVIVEERSESEEDEEEEEEEEEEEDEEDDSEIEEMGPERAKEVAEKLAREVQENAMKDLARERRRSSECGLVRRNSTGSDAVESRRSPSVESSSRRCTSLERRHSTGDLERPSLERWEALKADAEGSPSTAVSTSVDSTPTDARAWQGFVPKGAEDAEFF
ncbi:unnamed protein product [Durusdinium trenchii]|uniref:Uncharacterized protein n=2 Tax=Durusdinium trenchii TaxID=1381693 RepID=A0ABP0SS14_9DINO